MRASIIASAIAITLSLLLGASATVVAQTQEDDYLVTPIAGQLTEIVSARAACAADKVDLGNVVQYRDLTTEYVYEWNDPRLPQTLQLTWNWDAYRVPGSAGWAEVEWGTARMEDEQGAWEGMFRGSLGVLGRDQQLWLEGSGAYAGLCAVLNSNDRGYGTPTLTGLIFEGGMPPVS